MAKSELGTKRVDPETGRKFYDLNRDPIVSPYTGKTYPRSYFETDAVSSRAEEDEEEHEEVDVALEKPEFISPVEGNDDAPDDDVPDLGDDDVEIEDDDDDTFLAEDEDDGDDDVSGILGGGISEDEES
ncbi:MAG: TIGR02300 family protein [Phyllobacterium sp.]